MKRCLFAALTGVFFFASSSTAIPPGRILVAINGIDYSDFGRPLTQSNARGNWMLNLGLRGGGTLDCGGNAACESRSFDGAAVTFDQDFQIVIDVISAGVVALEGQSRGTLGLGSDLPSSGEIREKFSGKVAGSADCAGGSCTVGLTLIAQTSRGSLLLNLEGLVTLTESGPVWDALGGVGVLGVVPEVCIRDCG